MSTFVLTFLFNPRLVVSQFSRLTTCPKGLLWRSGLTTKHQTTEHQATEHTMEWVRIFSTEDEARQRVLPDRPKLVILGSKRVCLVLHQDKFYAVQDSCTHNGESLSKGRINYLGEVICPWHGYRFDLETGRACDSSCRDLATYPLKIDDSGLFIGLP